MPPVHALLGFYSLEGGDEITEHQARPEDFELEQLYQPLADKTLEETVGDGESDWEKQQAKDYVR